MGRDTLFRRARRLPDLFACLLAGFLSALPAAPAAAESGITLAVADWVPDRNPTYGGWGVVPAGQSVASPLAWTRDADRLAVPPGDYDVYWTQDYLNRDRPLLLATNVRVAADELTTVAADSGLRLALADWVPPPNPNYGWWGAVPAGGAADAPVNWTRSAAALLLPPGAYDVYWVQEYVTRDRPVLLAAGVAVTAGAVTTVAADSGLRLALADWVPPLDPNYGWWGAVPAGGAADAPVNWTRSEAALLLPPGAYDVYWVQNYATRGRPLLLASGVTVAAGAPTAVPADAAIRLDVAPGTPPLDGNSGWWGAAPSGRGPDERVNWWVGTVAEPLLLPPGTYDVYWAPARGDAPQRLAESVTLAAGEIVVASVGGIAAQPAAPAERDPPSGGGSAEAVDTILDSDDFSDPASGWTTGARGLAQIGYGQDDYRIVFFGPSVIVLGSSDVVVGDGFVEIDTLIAPGSGTHPYGLFVRGQDDRNFHAFVVGADSSYAAFHVRGGAFGMDSPPDAWLPAGAYHAGKVNRLSVRADGDELRYFVNGQHVVTIPTALWPSGKAGVIAAKPDRGWAEIRFDNWRVTVLE
jgi:hypothetical protein